jgi:hypothetical protein
MSSRSAAQLGQMKLILFKHDKSDKLSTMRVFTARINYAYIVIVSNYTSFLYSSTLKHT